MKKLNWGIVGTGWMGTDMGVALEELDKGIYAVAATSQAKADDYQTKHPSVQKAYGHVDELLKDENVDIVYIATPHSNHYEIMKKALLANKHVLVEKSITVNYQQLEECVKIAKERNLVISDAQTIFHMPLYKKLRSIVESGELGKVKMLQINFGSCREYDESSRFFAKEKAGGGLLDIGVYATSFARMFLKSRPNVVLTTVNFFPNGVDESSGIILKNPDQELAVISLTMCAKQPKRGLVACEKGYIEVYDYPRADKATITYTADGHTETIEDGLRADALKYEILDMEDYVLNGNHEKNLQMVEDVMYILTAVKDQWGMVYPFE